VGGCRAADRLFTVSPHDGVPAATHQCCLVLATAIYFGIRAFELHGRPTMTLANATNLRRRQRADPARHVSRREQALMFAVNPVGVQGDGSYRGANVTASGFIAVRSWDGSSPT